MTWASFLCLLFGHKKGVPSFEFAYLHEDCPRCGEVLKTVADTEELVEKGILTMETFPIKDDD